MPGAFEFGLLFGAAYAAALAPVLLLGLAVPYAVLRMEHGSRVDPQLGMKAGLQFFFSLAVLLAVTGVTVIVVDYVARDAEADDAAKPPAAPFGAGGPGADFGGIGGFGGDDGRPPFGKPDEKKEAEFMNPAQRLGLALILSGAILIGAVHVTILLCTDDANWGRVRRVFAGWRFAIEGLAAAAALTMLCIVLLAKERPDRALQTLVGVLFVWTSAASIDSFLLRGYATGPRRRPNDRADLPDQIEVTEIVEREVPTERLEEPADSDRDEPEA